MHSGAILRWTLSAQFSADCSLRAPGHRSASLKLYVLDMFCADADVESGKARESAGRAPSPALKALFGRSSANGGGKAGASQPAVPDGAARGVGNGVTESVTASHTAAMAAQNNSKKSLL